MEELFKNLGIEWKILIAQAINFGILLAVLTKFAYKPIKKVLDDRKKQVEEAHLNAQEIEKRLKKVEESEQTILNEARLKSGEIIKDAENRARLNAERIVTEAERKVSETINAEKIKLKAEKDKVILEIKKELGGVIAKGLDKISSNSIDDKSKLKMVEEVTSAING